MTSRRAVIDIGTNSVKLLVGDIASGTVHPLHEASIQTRLGAGFYGGQELTENAIRSTAAAAGHFAQVARDLQSTHLRILGTSAAREARNAGQLAGAVQAQAGSPLEILDGNAEADLARRGVRTDPALADRRLVIIDTGGGSTEIIVDTPDQCLARHSFRLGTVRWLEHAPLADPPSHDDFETLRLHLDRLLESEIIPLVAPHLQHAPGQPWLGVGTSGTATILARLEHRLDTYARDRLDGTQLTAAGVRAWRERLWSITLARRRELPGLPPDRADVILPGVAIYEAALNRLGLETLFLTLRGLRYGALLEPGP